MNMASFKLNTGDTHAALTITHPDGGTSEIMVHINDDTFQIDVDPSSSNQLAVGVDGDLIYSDGGVV